MKHFERKTIIGILFCIAIAFLSKWLTTKVAIGAITWGILIGVFANSSFSISKRLKPGLQLSEHILSIAIVLLGVDLNYGILQELGWKSFGFIVICLTSTLSLAYGLGRIFKLNQSLALLIGIGSGICGSAAIVATQKILQSEEKDAAIAIAVINLLGTIGLFALPALATMWLHLDSTNTGFLLGNTLQAVWQVVASGFNLGSISGETALIVKMARILLLTPVSLALAFIIARGVRVADGQQTKAHGIPFFIWGFIAMSILATTHIIPATWIRPIKSIAEFLLLVSMVAIGSKITLKTLFQHGRVALAFGIAIFAFQILMSVLVIQL